MTAEIFDIEVMPRIENDYLGVSKEEFDKLKVSLSDEFISKYKNKQPKWSVIGYITYKRTYARDLPNGKTEEYWQTVKRVVEGIFTIQKIHCYKNQLPWSSRKANISAQRMFELIWDFKFTPPGRGLWMMGTDYVFKRGGASLNNCFSGDTEFYTDKGTVKFKDVVGEKLNVLTYKDGYHEAMVNSYGIQELQKIVLKPLCRSNYRISYDVTKNHRWLLEDGSETTDIRIGNRIITEKSYQILDEQQYNTGFAHGIIFGDGTRHTYYPERHFIRLCDKENRDQIIKLLESIDGFKSTTHPSSYNGDPVVTIIRRGENWKQLPISIDDNYKLGFIKGWLYADSSKKSFDKIDLASQNSEAIDWFIKESPKYGFYITGHSISDNITNYGKRKNPLHRLSISLENTRYEVEKIINEGKKEEVFCVEEPLTHTFTLAYGIPTGNCAFVSTENINLNFSEPFCFLMDMSMLGVGVGGDIKGEGKITIKAPEIDENLTYEVLDSREGWVELLRLLLNSFVGKNTLPMKIDYSKVRPMGTAISTFGGVASGPQPLIEMYDSILDLLHSKIGQKITSSDIVDIFNLVGRCVVSGGVRRTAEIMFGRADDIDFLDLKNPEINKDKLMHHRWASNNSIFATVGMDYSRVAERTARNGEPGYEWLENAQNYSRMGRPADFKDTRAKGGNPCLEQTLEPYELCCVTGVTRIQTKEGIPRIKDTIGKEIEVWNGEEWSKVKPFLAQKNKKILRVHLSDGSYLDCTEEHEFSVKGTTKRLFEKKQAKNLEIGDTLPEFSLNITKGKSNKYAYEYGLFAGDGYIDNDNPMLCICGDKDLLKNKINGKWYKPQILKGYAKSYNRVNLKGIINMEFGRLLRQDIIPEEIFRWDKESILNFIAGLIDTDGSLRIQENNEHYAIFGSESKLRDIQLLLRRANINHSTLRLMSKKGTQTNKGIRTRDLFVLYIPTYECQEIPTKLKIVKRFGNGKKQNNAYENSEISYKRRQKVVAIEELNEKQDTYCFSEPKKHMGVFANILTYQCLVETYPSKHETIEEWIETLKYAYLYAKTVTLVPTHNALTNSVMLRNRRIGCSVSGVVQAFKKFGRRNVLNNLNKGYNKIQDWDKQYSEWLCIPRSIKTTSVKPSGTVSLLAGVTPGIHYPISEYYIRNIRFQEGSLLLDNLKKAGYFIEKDKYSLNTWVVSFPVKEDFFDRSIKDVTMWEQLENASALQENWADNQVSVTVSFDKNESKDIKNALELYETKLKGVSFLPKEDHGYEQAPYIPITQEKYEELIKEIKTIKISESDHEQSDKFCDGDACLIN